MKPRWTRLAFGTALAAASACEASPLRWSDPVAMKATSVEADLRIDSAGRVSWSPARAAARPPVSGACITSVRVAVGAHAVYAAWWSIRADSSAILYAGRSPDGGASWPTIARVDTSDVSGTACRRPSPSIAVLGDDVYVAYAMKAPEGTGVFFAHSMDGGAMFHSPVPVAYGDRLVASAVAANGDRVAVAYEELNGAARGIDVALSHTQGHIFEAHASASEDVGRISAPEVAIAGQMIAVGWNLQPAGDGVVRVVRVGRLRL